MPPTPTSSALDPRPNGYDGQSTRSRSAASPATSTGTISFENSPAPSPAGLPPIPRVSNVIETLSRLPAPALITESSPVATADTTTTTTSATVAMTTSMAATPVDTPTPVRTQDTEPAPLTPAPAPAPEPTPTVPATAHAAAPPPTPAHPLTVELKPYRIELNRHGTATVRLRASVVDTQTVTITLPRSGIATTLRSLVVSDSRGTTPTVILPSPPRRNAHNEPAWQTLLAYHHGYHLSVTSSDGSHSGRVIGFEASDPRSTHEGYNTLILDEDGRIGIYGFEDHGSLKIDAPPSNVEQCLPHIVSNPFITLSVTANGVGPGTLCVAYNIKSPFDNAYDILYRLHVPAAGHDDARFSNVKVVCTAVVNNPTPFDLKDVELCLIADAHRKPIDHMAHRDSDSDSGNSSPARSRSSGRSSTTSISRSSTSSPKWRRGRYKRCGLDTDVLTVSSACTETDYAREWKPLFHMEVPQRITLGANESTIVTLFESTCEAGMAHFIHCNGKPRERRAERAFVIRNTTNIPFEPGLGHIVFGSAYAIPIKLDYIPVGRVFVGSSLGESGVRVRTRSSKKVNDVSCRTVETGLLQTTVEWIRTVKIELYNKEQDNVDVVVIYIPASAWNYEEHSVVKLYEDEQDVNKEGAGTPWKRMDSPTGKDVPHYSVPLRSGQTRVLVFNEKIYEDRRLSSNRNPRILARLLQLHGVTKEVADSLRNLISMSRRVDSLQRLALRHERKMAKVRSFADRVADEYWTPDNETINGEHGADRDLRKYFDTSEKAENTLSKLQDQCDSLAEEIVGLEASIRRLEEKLGKMMDRDSSPRVNG